MSSHPRCAVVFDVDGPLLHLTVPEEDAFFAPLETLHGLTGLSRDWDSYRIRNDREILHEILHGHLGDGFRPAHYDEVCKAYERVLEDGFGSGRLNVSAVNGARQLLDTLSRLDGLALGMATANLRAAARIRLEQAGLWTYVSRYPGAADEGGHKHQVLARVLDALDLPAGRVVYVGDNLNDLEAARMNRTHFIGFHVDAARRQRLSEAGAAHVAGAHEHTLALIGQMLDLDP